MPDKANFDIPRDLKARRFPSLRPSASGCVMAPWVETSPKTGVNTQAEVVMLSGGGRNEVEDKMDKIWRRNMSRKVSIQGEHPTGMRHYYTFGH